MPQKQKVSAEEKVKAIEDYINNRISLSEAARRGGVARDTISQWARNYEADGMTAFMTCRNRVYSPELKRQAVEDYLSGMGSQSEICRKYHIRKRMQLQAWIQVYNAHGDLNSRKNSGGPDYKLVFFGIENPNVDFRAKDIEEKNGFTSFTVEFYGASQRVTVPTVGIHNVYDALAAFAVGYEMRMEPRKIAAGLKSFVPSGMRQRIKKVGGITVIEDCYNASPDSQKAALDVLSSFKSNRRIAVLGDMLELGKYSDVSHENVGKYTENKNIDILFTYGAKAKHIAEGAKGFVDEIKSFDDKNELAKTLLETLKDGDAVLFKASRGMKLEDVINSLYREWEE